MTELFIGDIAWLAFVGLLGGLFDSIAGGGGLISIPALLGMGLSPVQALATNKFQSSFGATMAAWSYARRGLVSPRKLKRLIVWTFTGSLIGALSLQAIEPALLEKVIPFLLVGIALYFAFGSRTKIPKTRMAWQLFAPVFGLGLGFYDGFFGPGVGAFWTLALVSLIGQSLVHATATTKVANCTSNLAAFCVFACLGHFRWEIGICMALGQLVGANLGPRLVVRLGPQLIRYLLVVVTIGMAIKLLLGH